VSICTCAGGKHQNGGHSSAPRARTAASESIRRARDRYETCAFDVVGLQDLTYVLCVDVCREKCSCILTES